MIHTGRSIAMCRSSSLLNKLIQTAGLGLLGLLTYGCGQPTVAPTSTASTSSAAPPATNAAPPITTAPPISANAQPSPGQQAGAPSAPQAGAPSVSQAGSQAPAGGPR